MRSAESSLSVLPETICEAFRCATNIHPDKIALMHRGRGGRYEGITYGTLQNLVNRVALSIQAMGLKKGDTVAIFSHNRPEWAIVDLAVLKMGAIVVPIYPTLMPPNVKYILNDSATRLVFVENAELYSVVAPLLAETPSVRAIIVFNSQGIPAQQEVLDFQTLKEGGSPVDETAEQGEPGVRADDTATIVYTSGTTGEPKGVVLTHRNIVFEAFTAIRMFNLCSDDIILSFLPLSHMFERTCGYYSLLFAGGSIAYAESMATVARDVIEIRPTIATVVPRVIEKAYEKIDREVVKGSSLGRTLTQAAVKNLNEYANRRYRKQYISPWLRLKCCLLDRLIATKFRAIAGGRVRLLVSGGAALPRQLGKLFYILGFPIFEGYGLTETSPIISCNLLDDNILGTVGKPIPGIEVKIGEDSEIMVRGPNVMKGYFNRPAETAKAIDADGWFHTGDQGHFDANGHLRITGRIKDLIVTSYGKKVVPTPIEYRINNSAFVEQAVLCGDGEKCVGALIVPQRAAIERYAAEQGIRASGYTELLHCQEIAQLITAEIEKATADCAPFEKVKGFHLLAESFTVENGFLTPTLKVRRKRIREIFHAEIQSIFAETKGS